MSDLAKQFVQGGKVLPFTVTTKATKWKGGRHWQAGAHIFDTPEKLAELGEPADVEKLLGVIALDPLFTVTAAVADKKKA